MSATTRAQHCTLMMVKVTSLLALVPMFAGGCSSGGGIMTSAQRISGPEQGKVLVTFIRPSSLGGAISFGIWDTESFVGVLNSKTCIQYQTTPGEHYFLSRAENWSCVKADLAAGKHYVIKANPVMGVWKARVAMDPVTRADYQTQLKQVQKWLAQLKPMAPNPQQIEAYSQSRRVQVLEARSTFQSGKGKSETLASGDCLPE